MSIEICKSLFVINSRFGFTHFTGVGMLSGEWAIMIRGPNDANVAEFRGNWYYTKRSLVGRPFHPRTLAVTLVC